MSDNTKHSDTKHSEHCEKAAAHERARIVAWLRRSALSDLGLPPHHQSVVDALAAAIAVA
jgi:hypothetical protein